MKKEEFIDIKGFSGMYQVSTFGNVRSNSNQVKGKNMKPVTVGGYLRVKLCKGHSKKPFFIHRIVADAFIPNPESKPQVNHIDLDKTNNHVSNLEWCTPSHNIRHSYANGRAKKDSSKKTYKGNKLTSSDVERIMSMRGSMMQKDIAKLFGVTPAVICGIYQGRLWKFIEPNND
jgi:hypothetical protein